VSANICHLSVGSVGRCSSVFSQSLDADALFFEPLLVEYLNIERFVASTSTVDKFRTILFGKPCFARDKQKIETLWAFIEAHEKIIHRFPDLKNRFPDLMERLRGIVNEAKHDMLILETLSPQHFHFVKHFLALRVIMTMKTSKIKEFVQEGFVSSADGSSLQDSIQERLHEMEHVTPRMSSRVSINDSAERLKRTSGSWATARGSPSGSPRGSSRCASVQSGPAPKSPSQAWHSEASQRSGGNSPHLLRVVPTAP